MSYFDDNEDRITGNRNLSYLLNPRLLAGTSQGIRNLLKINKLMQIQILNVSQVPATTKGGKPYTVLDIAYKNLTFQGKVEGKKLMPFGENANAFKALEKANSGETYDIQVVKNAAGYNDWITATISDGTKAPVNESYAPKTAQQTSTPVRSTYETPEERAKKQVYIIRQSNISSAVNLLSVGSKAPLKVADVLGVAKQLEDYVLGLTDGTDGFDSMANDLPE